MRKRRKKHFKTDKTYLIHGCIIMIIITLFSIIYTDSYAEQVYKCRKVVGHECTSFEIEEMFNKR